MARLVWDQVGEKKYETGTDHGVIYPQKSDGTYDTGVVWNGLESVSETPSGADNNDFYADNIKYASIRGTEDFGATVEAYNYPPEFAVIDGSASPVDGVIIGQQTRKAFGMTFRSLIGNDVSGTDLGYKIHIIYGATVSPSERAYSSVNDSPELLSFSWELTTVPVPVSFKDANGNSFKPTASVVIDSTKFTTESAKAKLKALEDILYGTDGDSTADPAVDPTDPRLPLPDEIFTLLSAAG